MIGGLEQHTAQAEKVARDREVDNLACGGQISQIVVGHAQAAVEQAVAAKASADAALTAASALAGRSVTGDSPAKRRTYHG